VPAQGRILPDVLKWMQVVTARYSALSVTKLQTSTVSNTTTLSAEQYPSGKPYKRLVHCWLLSV